MPVEGSYFMPGGGGRGAANTQGVTTGNGWGALMNIKEEGWSIKELVGFVYASLAHVQRDLGVSTPMPHTFRGLHMDQVSSAMFMVVSGCVVWRGRRQEGRERVQQCCAAAGHKHVCVWAVKGNGGLIKTAWQCCWSSVLLLVPLFRSDDEHGMTRLSEAGRGRRHITKKG